MMNEKLTKLIELLTKKTKAKEAIWNKASGNNQFKLLLPDGVAVTVSYYEGSNYNDDESYSVSIYNSNGDAIQRYSTDDKTLPEDLALITDFHQAASDQYYRVDETFDALLKSVTGQGIIGTIEDNSKIIDLSKDDGDLPF